MGECLQLKTLVYILWNNRQPSKGLLYLNEKKKKKKTEFSRLKPNTYLVHDPTGEQFKLRAGSSCMSSKEVTLPHVVLHPPLS